MTALAVTDLNLPLTLNSGQVFHWRLEEGVWKGVIGTVAVELRQEGGQLFVTPGTGRLVSHYLALDHPLGDIYASFPKDRFAQEALEVCRGLRIIRQPHWECVATFITSAMKQVSHIRAMSLALRARHGKPVEGSLVAAYPEAGNLAALDEEVLRACGLGFRAPLLLGAARKVDGEGIDLPALAALETEDLREALCRLPGVGRKVANCVLLFAYGRLDAVPVDVWVARIARAMDRRRRKATLLELEKFTHKRFGPYAGYVQQYLFHHARVSKTLPHS